jgi:hypothetical protein
MSNVTTDFVSATKKIASTARAILATLQTMNDNVGVIRENVMSERDKEKTHSQTNDSDYEVDAASGKTSQGSQAKRKKEDSKQEEKSAFSLFKNEWWKYISKPKAQVAILTLVIIGIYTCETRTTNELTEKALTLQFTLSRAFIQITLANFVKGTIEDVQKAGTIPIELQNTGRSIASKVHGNVVVEFPLAKQAASLNLSSNPTTITRSPVYPGTSPESISLIFADKSTITQISPQTIQELKAGTRYAVVFGRIEYEDSFGKWWTQFCGWRHFMPVSDTPQIVGFNASACVDYNIEGGTPKEQ